LAGAALVLCSGPCSAQTDPAARLGGPFSWFVERQYPEVPSSYVTDLRPVLRELAKRYPELSEEILKQVEKPGSARRDRLELRRILVDNEREMEEESSIIAIRAYPNLAGAMLGFGRTLDQLSAAFERWPKEKGPLGEIAATFTYERTSSSVILLRRNVVVWVHCDGRHRSSKTDRSGNYLPDPGLEDRAIQFARALDELLINAK
jgi:hypothetical protein